MTEAELPLRSRIESSTHEASPTQRWRRDAMAAAGAPRAGLAVPHDRHDSRVDLVAQGGAERGLMNAGFTAGFDQNRAETHSQQHDQDAGCQSRSDHAERGPPQLSETALDFGQGEFAFRQRVAASDDIVIELRCSHAPPT